VWLCRRWPCRATPTLRSHQSSFGAKSERWLLKVDDVRVSGVMRGVVGAGGREVRGAGRAQPEGAVRGLLEEVGDV